MKALLEAGAAVSASTDSGFTPISLAAKGGFDGIVNVLLGAGATLDCADNKAACTP